MLFLDGQNLFRRQFDANGPGPEYVREKLPLAFAETFKEVGVLSTFRKLVWAGFEGHFRIPKTLMLYKMCDEWTLADQQERRETSSAIGKDLFSADRRVSVLP